MNKTSRWERVQAWAASPVVEWGFHVVFASMPFWLGAIIVWATSEVRSVPNGQEWSKVFLATLSRGELFIFSATFLAPAFWAVSFDRAGSRPFPLRTLWIAILLVVWVTASCVFGIWRSSEFSGTTYSGIVVFSIVLAVFSVVIRLGVMLSHYYREPPLTEETFNEDANDLVESYGRKMR